MPWNSTCYYFTNLGSARENNEDSILLNDQIISSCSMKKSEKISRSEKNNLFCIADGVGGYNKGEMASKEVLTFISQIISDNPDISIEDAINRSKKHLDHLVANDSGLTNFGTTLAGIYLKDSTICIFNCGDSRVYRLNDPYFEKVTEDHSIVETLVKTGLIDENEARAHPQKNVITSGIFGDSTTQSPRIFIKNLSPRNEEIFLICSDGVWETISVDLLEYLYKTNGIENFAESLLNECLQKKAEDNISAIVVHLIQRPLVRA
jgi:protein phosphatase